MRGSEAERGRKRDGDIFLSSTSLFRWHVVILERFLSVSPSFFFFSKDTWFLFHSHTVARLLQKWEENRNLGHRVIVKLASMKEEGMDISTLDIFVAGFTELTQFDQRIYVGTEVMYLI